jgi:hypothetical protein
MSISHGFPRAGIEIIKRKYTSVMSCLISVNGVSVGTLPNHVRIRNELINSQNKIWFVG